MLLLLPAPPLLLLLQVALERETGNLSEAIDVLVTYVDHYMNDREAWEELAECYLEVWGAGVCVGYGWEPSTGCRRHTQGCRKPSVVLLP